jgi:uncharacterized protein (TIGR02246 family)
MFAGGCQHPTRARLPLCKAGKIDGGMRETFGETLQRHFDAIRARDLEALASTVAPDQVHLVTANGEVSTSAQHFLDLHRDWFASPTWQLTPQIVATREGGDLATCLVELEYTDEASDGAGRIRERSILSLVFELRDGRWLMIQDQNTPVRA